MLEILLSIIGLIFIILSLIYINKIEKKEKDYYEELIDTHNNIKQYSLSMDKKFNDFYNLIDSRLNEANSLSEKDIKDNQYYKKEVLENLEDMDEPSNEIFYKIKELRNVGFSNEEIAKKLNKGIREIDIIMKLHNNL